MLLYIPQSSSITGASPSDCLMSYTEHLLGVGVFTPLQKCSQCILQPKLTERGVLMCLKFFSSSFEFRIFPSPWLVPLSRLKNPGFATILPKHMRTKENAINLVQDLSTACQVHFLIAITAMLYAPSIIC